MDFMTKSPFHLSDQDVAWVTETYESMSLEEKIGQLFCPIGYSTNADYLKHELLAKKIGGLFFRDGESKEMRSVFDYAQKNSRIPLLIPANLEAGGDGAATDGTSYGKPMAAAAANNSKYAYRLGKIATSEGAALGCNWTFAPVVDIDYNFRNPITNVRTYGSDPEVVLEYALEYMRAATEEGVAVSIKHFPGDGVDERDQHLLTSINDLSMKEWNHTFGHVYRGLIDAGALTVMVGHIALPSYQNHLNPADSKRVVPASLSPELIEGLLRRELGFNGLIVTDATPMVGFTSAMDRQTAVPYAIESGCDMFLFNKDLAEDHHFMMEGYQKGILSEERLREAVLRILATKAALRLHIKQAEHSLVPGEDALTILKNEEHVSWAKELADQSITLVKDTQKLLPIVVDQHRKVLLQILGDCKSNERVISTFESLLTQQGFQVTIYEQEDLFKGADNVRAFKEKYDLVIYLGNVENASNKTTNRINWYTLFGMGNNLPWFVYEVPTVFISLANPYHLFDVPMIKTYINCYSNNNDVLESVAQKLLGRSSFKGVNPVDPFCGREDLRY